MAAVKERVTTLVVVKPQSKFESGPKTSSGPGDPPDPPELPPGGGRRRSEKPNKVALYLFAVFLAVIFWLGTAETYSIALGRAVVAQAIGLFAWFILIVAAGKCSMRGGTSSPSRPETMEDMIDSAKARLLNHYWDGLLLIVICFHLAVYNDIFGLVQIAAIAAVLITLAYFVERLRFRYFPQTATDLADLLSL